MNLRIRYFGDPILRTKGVAVREFDDRLANLSEEMLQAMRANDGIGLAAQQIGQALQFCVVDVPDNPDYPSVCILDGKPVSPALLMPLCLSNPEIQALNSDEYYYEEGCLSFPGVNGDVARPERILATYQDLDGARHSLECDGLLARCIQHEIDHLNGILFIDRMEKATFAGVKRQTQALKRQTMERLKKGNPDPITPP